MKLKKFLASIIAAAAVGSFAVTGYAVNDGEATYCFDTNAKIADWQTYGSTAETGFAVSQLTGTSFNGDGCMVLSEKLDSDLENGSGGIYITAETVGLESFDNCTISAKVLLAEGAENAADQFSIYSDGTIWLQSTSPTINSITWSDITLVIPANADNSRIGFTIPTYSAYSGNIVYIDDVVITRDDGTVISNVGDYKIKTLTSENVVPTGVNIALIILLVVLVLAIIGGIGLIVSNVRKKFT